MKFFSKQTALIGYMLLMGPVWAFGEDTPPSTGVLFSSAIIDFNELDAPVQMLNDEFDPALLENLPPPTAPPPHVYLPHVVIGKDQWRGSQCGITKSFQGVFRKVGVWEKFWAMAIKPYLLKPIEVPKIDFEKDMVIGVFMGEKPAPSYQIEILSIKKETETKEGEPVLKVRYRMIQNMQAVFNPPFPIQPFHLKKVPLFTGLVVFQEIKR